MRPGGWERGLDPSTYRFCSKPDIGGNHQGNKFVRKEKDKH